MTARLALSLSLLLSLPACSPRPLYAYTMECAGDIDSASLRAVLWTQPDTVAAATFSIQAVDGISFPLAISPMRDVLSFPSNAEVSEAGAGDDVSTEAGPSREEWDEFWMGEVELADVPEWEGLVCPPGITAGVRLDVTLEDGRTIPSPIVP